MLRTLLTSSALVALAAPLHAGTVAEDAAAFGTRENVQQMTLSPDGSKVAILTAGPGSVTVLKVADLGTGALVQLTSSDGRPNQFRWCKFAGNSHLVCEYGGIEPVGESLVSFSRLMSIAVNGAAMKPLGQLASNRDAYLRQDDGGIVDWLPGQEGKILMARQYVPETNTTGSNLGRLKDGLAVDMIDLSTMKVTSVEPAKDGVDDYMTDGTGQVRLYTASTSSGVTGRLTGLMKVRYRPSGSKEWRDLSTYDSRTDQGLYPLAIDHSVDALYALKDVGGRDTLVRVKLDGSAAETPIASNPKVDIDNVVRLDGGQRVIGYTFADERRHHVYFDPEFSKLQKSLSKAIPRQPLIDFLEASSNGSKLLIHAGGDDAPGTYYRFDKPSRKLEEIALVRPELESRTLAKVESLTIAAADGTRIPAYLTLPPGGTGKNLPTVVLPHGGPSARDEWGFDWLAQFLAARGYAVVQPNYRGSSGYGDQWLAQNGFKGWRTSIGDVTAAARFLVAQGIADPNRLAILGWSYGGYAALQSAAVEPGLYKAAVAIAPVTDFRLVLSEAEGFTNANLVRSFVGTGPHLTEGSPLPNAAKIKIPVLLVHGDRDANVGILQSERMENALRKAGTPVEYLRFKGLDHQLSDSNARISMLTSIGNLLDRTIGR